jgi:hypothetical protein
MKIRASFYLGFRIGDFGFKADYKRSVESSLSKKNINAERAERAEEIPENGTKGVFFSVNSCCFVVPVFGFSYPFYLVIPVNFFFASFREGQFLPGFRFVDRGFGVCFG